MRDLLIALCGLTPQVVTETLWALRRRHPPIVPEKVLIVTTQSGKDVCERLLLGAKGQLTAYVRDYPDRPSIRRVSSIVALKGSDGRAIQDLRTQEDSFTVADQLAALIRQWTAFPDVRIHCSVAGGRKTMGVLLAAVLQIYGRENDRLYHVLVSPIFESHPEFFYVPKRPRLLATPDGKQLDTREARIELAEIPYVRLRAFLSQDLLKRSLPFTELVILAQKELRGLERPQAVKVDLDTNHLIIGNATVRLSPAQARLYGAFAQIKTAHCVQPARKSCEDCIACYVPISKTGWDTAREKLETLAADRFVSAGGIAYFRSLLSKTNHAIVKELGSERLARCYEITSKRLSGETHYGLVVDKTLIDINS